MAALLFTPLWLLAPWVDGRPGHIADRVFLRRRYSPAEAERLFTSELQAASSEDDLRSRAERVLVTIFQARAEVRFAPVPPTDGQDPRAMVAGLRQSGWAAVEPRGSGNPFMSDERSLFHSLAGTLATVLENVRFREEQHRQLERENSSVSSSAAPNLKRRGPKSIRISFSTRSMPLPASTRAGRSDH